MCIFCLAQMHNVYGQGDSGMCKLQLKRISKVYGMCWPWFSSHPQHCCCPMVNDLPFVFQMKYILMMFRCFGANEVYISGIYRETLYTKKVSTTSTAASVPDEVFHNARGMQLCNIEAYQCPPAFFADSYHLNSFSSEVIASRAPVPPSARVITERHIISFLPVTRVIMAHRKRSFSFYIVGYNWDIFVRDYPARFCWGLCCCFEWLNM